MVAWRDAASRLAQGDVDALSRAAIPRAQREIEATGGFYPFAFVIDPQGELVSFMIDEDSDMDASAGFDFIWSSLVDGRHMWRAVAVAYDIRVPAPDSAAVRVDLEHVEGTCLSMMLPYSQRRPGTRYRYGSLAAAIGEARVWSDPEPT